MRGIKRLILLITTVLFIASIFIFLGYTIDLVQNEALALSLAPIFFSDLDDLLAAVALAKFS